MALLDFIKKESGRPISAILVIGAVAGLSNALILAVINAAVQSVESNNITVVNLTLYVILIAVYIFCQRYMMFNGTRTAETIVDNLRLRLTGKVMTTSLRDLERIGKADIFTKISNETNAISISAGYLLIIANTFFMIIFVFLYLAFISAEVFLVLLALVLLAAGMYKRSTIILKSKYQTVQKTELQFFNALTDSLLGIKEIKMDSQKRAGLSGFINSISDKLFRFKEGVAHQYVDLLVYSQVFFYILLGVSVFVLPQITKIEAGTVVKATTAILFIIGPVGGLFGALPFIDKIKNAISSIYQLEEQLDKGSDERFDAAPAEFNFTAFSSVEYNQLTFSYTDYTDHTFSVGPLNLTLKKGEILFLVGGNGSGKTTLLKLLTTLYEPDSGSITIDGKTLDNEAVPAFRALFTTIFSDFYLFRHLYGMEKTERSKVMELLSTMQLQNKVDFVNSEFSTLNLSTGQRKRLAMVTALLEKRSILVFDEWAADQDPGFREFYYKELLPQLQKSGKTIIAVSHDDRYFNCADRVVKMEFGKIQDIF